MKRKSSWFEFVWLLGMRVMMMKVIVRQVTILWRTVAGYLNAKIQRSIVRLPSLLIRRRSQKRLLKKPGKTSEEMGRETTRDEINEILKGYIYKLVESTAAIIQSAILLSPSSGGESNAKWI